MTIDVLMPALSPTMEEGTLAKWHVKVGDQVRSGDVIADIETDKATMEVEAVDEGVIEALLVPEGTEMVKINTPIARLAQDGDIGVQAPAPEPPSKPQAEPAIAIRPSQKGVEGQVSAPRPARANRVLASPLARRMAEQMGLDLTSLSGSGPRGRIIKVDVEAARSRPQSVPAASSASATQMARPVLSLAQMGIAEGSYDLLPLDNIRKTVARRLTDSFRDVPHFPLNMDINLDPLLKARTDINLALEDRGIKVSVNDLIIKAAAIALKQVPEANSSFTPEGIARHHHADIAMAVAIDGGLITPIIRKAETKGLAEIATETKDLAERARNRKLRLEEFQGGTFSISNLGMFGIKSFASIINEPQGAILSVGAGEARAIVKDGVLSVATMMSVTLTCDHRVVDGAIGARWLAAFKALIESPLIMVT